MNQNIHRHQRVEALPKERQRPNIALDQAVDAVAARIFESLGTHIERSHAPSIALSQALRKISRAAPGFERFRVACYDGIEQTEQNLAHTSIPPEIALAPGYVGEFGGIHSEKACRMLA